MLLLVELKVVLVFWIESGRSVYEMGYKEWFLKNNVGHPQHIEYSNAPSLLSRNLVLNMTYNQSGQLKNRVIMLLFSK